MDPTEPTPQQMRALRQNRSKGAFAKTSTSSAQTINEDEYNYLQQKRNKISSLMTQRMIFIVNHKTLGKKNNRAVAYGRVLDEVKNAADVRMEFVKKALNDRIIDFCLANSAVYKTKPIDLLRVDG